MCDARIIDRDAGDERGDVDRRMCDDGYSGRDDAGGYATEIVYGYRNGSDEPAAVEVGGRQYTLLSGLTGVTGGARKRVDVSHPCGSGGVVYGRPSGTQADHHHRDFGSAGDLSEGSERGTGVSDCDWIDGGVCDRPAVEGAADAAAADA